MENDAESILENTERKPTRQRGPAARNPLPSERAKFEVQLKVLRAYSNASAGGTKAVNLERLASVSQLSSSTVSSCNPFFVASNFIVKGDGGYSPTNGLLEYAKQVPWDEEKAKGFLREMMKEAWYTKELNVVFGVNPEMSEDEIIKALGSIVGARPDQRASLETLVKFILYAGLIEPSSDTSKFKLAIPFETIGMEKAEAPFPVKSNQNIEPLSRYDIKNIQGVSTGKAQVIFNFNLNLDITDGSVNEIVSKVNDIIKGIGKSGD